MLLTDPTRTPAVSTGIAIGSSTADESPGRLVTHHGGRRDHGSGHRIERVDHRPHQQRAAVQR